MLAGVLALACGADPRPAPAPVPPLLRGAIALEPPRIQLGDVAELEIAIATPPAHRVVALEPPDNVPGFWVLDATRLPVQRDRGRLVHRTRVRLRARAVGHHAWPPLQAEIEGPDGARRTISIEGRALDVVSVLPEFPDRTGPFGLRPPPAASSAPRGVLLPGAVGAALTLAGLALVVLVRRRAARTAGPLAEVAPPAPESEAVAALAGALARVEADPRGAASAGAAALRRFLARRFGVADADARTTEELARMSPSRGRAEQWAELMAALRALDAERFPRPTARAEGVRAALSDARGAVAETNPSEPRR